MKTVVPRVLNSSVLQVDRRAAASGRGEPWTAERFYNALLERQGENAAAVMRDIQEWVEAVPQLAIFFGKGKLDGSIQIAYKHGDDRSIYQPGDTVILSLWSYGRVEIEFQYLMTREAFSSHDMREELWRRLTSGSHLKIPADKIDKRPSVQWSELTDAANMQALRSAMEWIVNELSVHSSDARADALTSGSGVVHNA